jgi:hypothetical protein
MAFIVNICMVEMVCCSITLEFFCFDYNLGFISWAFQKCGDSKSTMSCSNLSIRNMSKCKEAWRLTCADSKMLFS